MVERLIREAERRQITGLGRTAWADLESRGQAPRRVQLIGSRIAWRLSELQDWIAKRPRATAA